MVILECLSEFFAIVHLVKLKSLLLQDDDVGLLNRRFHISVVLVLHKAISGCIKWNPVGVWSQRNKLSFVVIIVSVMVGVADGYDHLHGHRRPAHGLSLLGAHTLAHRVSRQPYMVWSSSRLNKLFVPLTMLQQGASPPQNVIFRNV